MNKIDKILTIILILSFHFAGAQTVEKVLTEWQNDTVFRHASWSFKAVNLSKDKLVAEHNAQKSLIPASVMKAVTVGTGFLVKSSAYMFETQLQYTGTITSDSVLYGDVIIYGKGDPTLGSPRFKAQNPDAVFAEWAQALRRVGIAAINGKIVAVPSYLNNESFPDGWTWGDIGNYYGTGVYGLNFMDNEYKIFFQSGKKVGDSTAIVRTEPTMSDVQFVNRVTTAAANTGDKTIIYPSIKNSNIHIRGTIPLQTNEFSVRGAMPNPPKILVDNFHDYLIQAGFTITEAATYQTLRPENATTFHTHKPVSYRQLANETMMRSVNLYAEAILLSLRSQENVSFGDNTRFVENYLKNKGLSTYGFRMTDGSGLSRSNFVSSDFLCDFLKMMHKTNSFTDFYATFPVAGTSGTIAGMCKGTAAQSNLRAKSGTMNAVRAYCGYVKNSAGDMICFSLIINNFNCRQSELTPKIEKLFTALAEGK
ncbi:MAG: D-alanyl-D-alanine carboxypeptidase/D-alanyl-D-alanine-endopeptidase [Bacteroidales bacterium]|nr:D-alanyl-D-alanine carboxypeptidase/D-alanyl-D-alanine-endopeptidase [Bacteroidales bacterium]